VVVRQQDTRRRVRAVHQVQHRLHTRGGVVVERLDDEVRVHIQPVLLHRAVEADDAVLRDGGFFAVDIRDFAVSLLISGIHQQLESADVVRQHA